MQIDEKNILSTFNSCVSFTLINYSKNILVTLLSASLLQLISHHLCISSASHNSSDMSSGLYYAHQDVFPLD